MRANAPPKHVALSCIQDMPAFPVTRFDKFKVRSGVLPKKLRFYSLSWCHALILMPPRYKVDVGPRFT